MLRQEDRVRDACDVQSASDPPLVRKKSNDTSEYPLSVLWMTAVASSSKEAVQSAAIGNQPFGAGGGRFLRVVLT